MVSGRTDWPTWSAARTATPPCGRLPRVNRTWLDFVVAGKDRAVHSSVAWGTKMGTVAAASHRSVPQRWYHRAERAVRSRLGRPSPAGSDRVIRIVVNLAGAAAAALFAQASLRF